MKWILRYIQKTLDVGLIFKKDNMVGRHVLDTAIQIMLVILINVDKLLVMCLLLQKHQLVGSLLYSQQWLCPRRRQSIWRSLKQLRKQYDYKGCLMIWVLVRNMLQCFVTTIALFI